MKNVSNNTPPPIVWAIAASDSGGGAGVQADIKTIFDLGAHACTAITGITAQNSQGVHHIDICNDDIFEKQLLALAQDLPPVAIKIGVLLSVSQVHIVTNIIRSLKNVCVIFDPVLAPTAGLNFVTEETRDAFNQLLPLVDLLTPNIPEAEMLSGLSINDTHSQHLAAQYFIGKGVTAVLIKGGHGALNGNASYCQDVFVSATQQFWLTQKKQNTPHSHGTGCTLSSAATAFVAEGKALCDAVVLANTYISKGLRLAITFDEAGYKRGAVAQTGWPQSLSDFPQVSLQPEAIEQTAFPSCDTQRLGLYPVVDSLDWLSKLCATGVKTLQLRVKDKSAAELDELVKAAVAIGKHYQARLFINDYWQLAIKHQAYGVHLGQEDMVDADVDAMRAAGLHLGISTHSEYEFAYAATFKPSYLAIGAIFPTDTKEVVEVGLDNLYRWADTLNGHYPLVAIGGINLHNIQSVLQSGVGSIAVVSAITKADDYISATKQLTKIIQ
ncbi:Phosphomethylpyrimidine kinase [gamma proteobacterium IMCC1989]|nr:Phosphomethylpyrimidine kinase [gamma proteobacterium IMCC1989]